jgi:hypothetical protein
MELAKSTHGGHQFNIQTLRSTRTDPFPFRSFNFDPAVLSHNIASTVVMSAKPESQTPAGTTKKFGKGERHVPHPSAKAKRYYPAEEDPQPKKVRLTMED